MKLSCALLLYSLAAPLAAQGCPTAPDNTDALATLIDAARSAKNEMESQAVSNEMWILWSRAPDLQSQELLDDGMERRKYADYDSALKLFDALIDYCPGYAEGYNQRAFVNFLRQDYEAALPDLNRAIELVPQHVAAITGKALTLIGLTRDVEAQVVLRQALALNPWLSERHFLTEQPGQDL